MSIASWIYLAILTMWVISFIVILIGYWHKVTYTDPGDPPLDGIPYVDRNGRQKRRRVG